MRLVQKIHNKLIQVIGEYFGQIFVIGVLNGTADIVHHTEIKVNSLFFFLIRQKRIEKRVEIIFMVNLFGQVVGNIVIKNVIPNRLAGAFDHTA